MKRYNIVDNTKQQAVECEDGDYVLFREYRALEGVSAYACKMSEQRLQELHDFDEMKMLCVEVLKAADRCSREPYYIVQPYLRIVKEYSEIINRNDLMQ